jgi:peptidyl-prolyl cis-trans isomerase C
MRKLVTTAVLCICVSNFAYAEETVVTVNDEALSTVAFTYNVNKLISEGNPDSQNLRNKVLDEMIIRELLNQQAEEQRLDDTVEFKLLLSESRATILSNMLITSVYEGLRVDKREIADEYAKLTQRLASEKQYNLQVIVTKTREAALTAISAINDGAEFSQVAEDFSIDNSSENGGNLGWRLTEEIVRDVSNVMINLAIGSISQSPISSASGWHVIKVLEQRAFAMPALEDMSAGISNQIKQEKLKDYLIELRASANIE